VSNDGLRIIDDESGAGGLFATLSCAMARSNRETALGDGMASGAAITSSRALPFLMAAVGIRSGASPLVSGRAKRDVSVVALPMSNVIASIVKVLFPSREVLHLALCTGLGRLRLLVRPCGAVFIDFHSVL